MNEEELLKYLGDIGALGSAVASETYDDLVAHGLDKSLYSKYKAAGLANKVDKLLGNPYKINLKYPEDRGGVEGFVARNWKATTPIMQKAIDYSKYYPTAKVYYNTLNNALNSSYGQDFDRWLNDKEPIDRNAL